MEALFPESEKGGVTAMELANSIASASMTMSRMEFEDALDITMMKKSMDAQAQQVEMLLDEMLRSVPLPTHGFDTYG